MRNRKAYLMVCLFNCLGFVVGFAVCHTFFTKPVTKQSSAPVSSSDIRLSRATNQKLEVLSVGAANGSFHSNNTGWRFLTPSPKDEDTDKKELVTLVHPTFPPEVFATFDPLEEVAKQFRNTNR